jgi:hypothetical protein
VGSRVPAVDAVRATALVCRRLRKIRTRSRLGVADGTGGILKIDPQTNAVVKRIPIMGVPKSLAFGLGRLWVALD